MKKKKQRNFIGEVVTSDSEERRSCNILKLALCSNVAKICNNREEFQVTIKYMTK